MLLMRFIITGQNCDQTADTLEAILIQEFDARPTRQSAPQHVPDDAKACDPATLASLILAIPCGILAVLDLSDRLRKRPKVQHLIEASRQLTVNGDVSITINFNATKPVPLESITPDQLLELARKALLTLPPKP